VLKGLSAENNNSVEMRDRGLQIKKKSAKITRLLKDVGLNLCGILVYFKNL
jgi:hypothetical protein